MRGPPGRWRRLPAPRPPRRPPGPRAPALDRSGTAAGPNPGSPRCPGRRAAPEGRGQLREPGGDTHAPGARRRGPRGCCEPGQERSGRARRRRGGWRRAGRQPRGGRPGSPGPLPSARDGGGPGARGPGLHGAPARPPLLASAPARGCLLGDPLHSVLLGSGAVPGAPVRSQVGAAARSDRGVAQETRRGRAGRPPGPLRPPAALASLGWLAAGTRAAAFCPQSLHPGDQPALPGPQPLPGSERDLAPCAAATRSPKPCGFITSGRDSKHFFYCPDLAGSSESDKNSPVCVR